MAVSVSDHGLVFKDDRWLVDEWEPDSKSRYRGLGDGPGTPWKTGQTDAAYRPGCPVSDSELPGTSDQ